MKKRDYPLFMIDRTKSCSYPNDYITCLDREVGFVAKVIHIAETDAYRALVESLHHSNEFYSIELPLKKGGLILQIVGHLYDFELTNESKSRIKVLLKKALKKYIHVEVSQAPASGDFSIEQQISQQRDTIDLAIRNYDNLIERSKGDRRHADYQIELARATLRTLERAKELSDVLSMASIFNNSKDEN